MAVEITSNVTVVIGTVASVTDDPLDSIVHSVGMPAAPTVIVKSEAKLPDAASPEFGS